jgi:hypothetical protein
MNRLLPKTVSKRLGAVLTGRSRPAFRDIVRFHELEDGRVHLGFIERLIGQEVTVEAYLAGQRTLDRTRARERARREKAKARRFEPGALDAFGKPILIVR